MGKVVKRPDGCWEWVGGGSFLLDNRQAARPHRAAMILWHVGAGHLVRCSRRSGCVNPEHLTASPTRQAVRGYEHPSCILTRELSKRIRDRASALVKTGNSAAYYARIYGVSREAVRLIRDHRTNGGLVVNQAGVDEIRLNCRSGYYGRLKTLSDEFGLSLGTIGRAIRSVYDENKPDAT